jgi:hypothetical protein
MELARLRRDAIDRTVSEQGMTYTAVAASVGVSKGRVTQIRHSAPPTERAFFGVGPVTVAIRHWRIRDRDSGQVWGSGMDEDPPRAEDVAYLGRVWHQGRALLVVAGVHAIGSLAALTWLAGHLPETHHAVGAQPFSMVVRCTYDGSTITGSEVVCLPRTY